MEPSALDALLAWIAAHPQAAGAVIFLVAFIDGLLAVGLLMPSGPFLIAVGTLIGLGSINGPYAIACAALGAFCGDGLSFGFGHHFGQRMKRMWPFARHPEWMERGEALIRRHGTKALPLGRYFGATRPFVPAIAGMLRMPLRIYLPVSAFAALTWAVMFIAPGWLLGASLELLLAVAGRLALVLAILIAVAVAIWFAVSAGYRWCAPHAAQYLERTLAWSHRHPLLGRISESLIEPARPESGSLLALALMLVGAGWALFWVMLAVAGEGEPLALDLAVYHALSGLRTPLADPLMWLLAALGELPVLLPASAVVFAWLLWRRRFIAAWHWLAAIGFGLLLVEVLGRLLDVPKPPAALAVPGFGFPSEPVALATVVYGFFAVLIARELPGRTRAWPYGVAGLLVALVVCARLYFGAHWLSDVLAGLTLGLIWTSALGIGYRRHSRRSFWMRPLALLFFGSVLLLAGWHGIQGREAALARFAMPELRHPVNTDAWWTVGWAELPARRNDLGAGRDWPFNLQYAGELEKLRVALEAQGWRTDAHAQWQALLKGLDGSVDPQTLPLLAASHNGRAEALRMSRPGATAESREVLRLWPAPLALVPGEAPVWQGTLARWRFDRSLRLLALWRFDGAESRQLDRIREQLPGFDGREIRREDGEPVLLLTAPPPGS